MGKGSRNRAAYNAEKIQKREALAKAQKKQKVVKRVTLIVVAFVLVGAIIGGVIAVINSVRTKNRSDFHNTVAVSSENYKVTTAMMSYFFNLQYITFQNTNYNNLSNIQLDTNTSLKEQTCDEQFAQKEGQTWYDYFYSLAEKQVTEMLCLLEAAKAEGYEMNDTDKETIKQARQKMQNAAEEYNMDMQEYLDYVYGDGMTQEEVSKAMEYYQHFSSYYKTKYANLQYTSDEITNYYNSNKKLFTTVDYLAYSFSTNISSYGDDETARNAAISTLRKTAETLTYAKTADEFKSNLKEYLDNAYNSNAAYTTIDPEEELENSVYTDVAYIEDNDVCEWAFSDSTKALDVKTFEEETDGTYYISVVMMTKTMERDETLTRDIRHILFTTENHGTAEAAKAKAKELLDTFNTGDKSEKSFAELATKYTEDPDSSISGGLYKGVSQGEMVESFNDWMFDKSRKAGDTALVESNYGCHIMYYPGVETAAWQNAVNSALVTDAFDADIAELKERYNVNAKNQDITKTELDY